MTKLVSVTNQVNTMCNPIVTFSVSVENNKDLREIAHGLFMNKDQFWNSRWLGWVKRQGEEFDRWSSES